MNLQDFTTALKNWAPDATLEELSQLNKVVIALSRDKSRMTQINAGRRFNLNDTVKFKSRGYLDVIGQVIKINEKTIRVYSPTTNVTWTVSPSLCTKVEA